MSRESEHRSLPMVQHPNKICLVNQPITSTRKYYVSCAVSARALSGNKATSCRLSEIFSNVGGLP